jgi:hypothetical protein
MIKSWDMVVGVICAFVGFFILNMVPKTKARLTELQRTGQKTPQEARRALMASKLVIICLFAIGSFLIARAWVRYFHIEL